MSLFINILLGIIVNFTWGLAFLIPYITTSTIGPILLTAGRYITYGLLSVILIMTISRPVLQTLSYKDWLLATTFALTGYVAYYIFLTLSIRFGDISITTLIVGISPITFAIYGNILQKEFPFHRLLFPLTFILTGLILFYWEKLSIIQDMSRVKDMFFSVFFALLALLSWTWYGVQNARYLKQKQACGQKLKDSDWSVIIGICSLIVTILALCFLALIGVWNPFTIIKIFKTPQLAMTYIAVSLVLGVLVSYCTTVLWNRISRELPVSLAGQLLVFETISSILYEAMADQTIPSTHEILSICIILLGVVFGVNIVHRSMYMK